MGYLSCDRECCRLDRPKVVVLCGSTRFVHEFNRQRQRLTYDGKIVLSIEVVTTQAASEDPQHVDPERKARLDELHLRKIDLADEVLVLNVGGYIGSSTRGEIEYAENLGRPIRYLEPYQVALLPTCVAPGCEEKAPLVFKAAEHGRLAGRDWTPGEEIRTCPEHGEDIYLAHGVRGRDHLAEWLREDAKLDALDEYDADYDVLHGREIRDDRAAY